MVIYIVCCRSGEGESHNQLPAVPPNGVGYHNTETHLNNRIPPITQSRSDSQYFTYFSLCIFRNRKNSNREPEQKPHNMSGRAITYGYLLNIGDQINKN